ncbi:MAG: 2-phosphosulfolactate phosphatase [Chloroflexi bacterium]|nr:MAG: 2-phosphosulfolactate phosphatase [Chloroflexota bacterium]
MERLARVRRHSLLDGARRAEGVAVVIDVYRAFTSAALMLHLGAEKLVLVAEAEAALDLKRSLGALAVGEREGRKVPGFDLGNSPAEVLAAGRALFEGRVVAQRTSAGVQGAVAAARHCEKVFLGSYLTAAATARAIAALSPPPEVVSLVAMGWAGRVATPDDEGCADYLEHLLTGRPYDHVATLQRIVEDEATIKFVRGDQPHYPPEDPIYCLQRDLLDFCLLLGHEGDRLVARAFWAPAPSPSGAG